MRPLSVHEMIGLWEKGELRSPVDQALLLLRAADPGNSLTELAKLHVGERDRRLLRVREKTFGSRLSCSVDCQWCSEDLHFEFETQQILQPVDTEPEGTFAGTAEGVDVTFRLPNSEDLMAAMTAGSAEEGKQRILERCLLSIRTAEEALRVADLPESAIAKVCELMSKSDPQAETRFDVQCSACGRSCQVTLDVTAFFWKEVSVRARRALSEVHLLASAYGWSEQDILDLSPVRREFYLQRLST